MTKKRDKPHDMAADIIGVIREGTKKWTRTVKAEERRRRPGPIACPE
jgi:hypothetical protein